MMKKEVTNMTEPESIYCVACGKELYSNDTYVHVGYKHFALTPVCWECFCKEYDIKVKL